MGRLRTLTILLTLSAWGAATEGAPPDNAAPSTTNPAARPPAPVPPVQYLEAGARLYNSGDYDKAAKYIKAADAYREQLTVSEQTVLDAYLRELEHAPEAAATPAAAPVVAPAPAPTADAATAAPAPPAVAAEAGAPAVVEASTDAKSKARWLLQAAREQLRQGAYDDAAAKVEQARALNVKWGLFDDTPAKVAEAVAKARPKAVAMTTPSDLPKNRSTAKAKLKEARAAIDNNQFEQAEALAIEVKSWDLSYGLFEDTPDKVAAAARALRRRDTLRNSNPRDQQSPGVYDVLVQEARQLSAAGQYDQAESKAKQAQRMNVVPAPTADRAEAVLHDLNLARAKTGPKGDQQVAAASGAAAGAADAAVVKAEQDGNDLLARGDAKGASAKFAEAEALRTKGADAPVELAPAANPADTAAPAPAAAATPGAKALFEAQALYKGGNYPAAKALAEKAKADGLGVDAEADALLAQIATHEQGGALSLYESALEAVRKGDTARAQALLTEVAAADGVDDGLREKASSLLARMKDGPAGKATATDKLGADDADTINAQKMNAEVGTKIAEGRRLQETDPDKAIALYNETLKAVKVAGLPAAAARTMTRRLEVTLELARKDKVAFDQKMKDKAFKTEIEQKRLRIFEADKAKKDRMKDLMDKAMQAMAESRYVDAETYAKRAMEVDPDDVTATALVWKAKIERRVKRDLENKNDKEEGVVTAFQEVDRAAVLDPEVQLRGIQYAKDFKDLTAERLKTNARMEFKKDPKTLEIESKLNETVSFNMEKQPLGDAIAFIRNYTGVNVMLDPKALSEVEVTSASPIDLVGKFKLKNALRLMLRPLGLVYKVDDDVLLITNTQAANAQTYAKPYYVGDLILSNQKKKVGPDGTPMSAAAFETNKPAGPEAPGEEANKVQNGERPNFDMSPLISLITASIAPGTWRVTDPSGSDVSGAYGMGGGFGGGGGGGAGGGVNDTQPIGSITPFFLTISLIIRHTAEIHDQVADLLKQLRRLQDLQVSIEVRFITVTDTFFEQIGVDFDFAIQSDVAGRHSSFAIPNPAARLFSGTGGNIGGGGGGNIGGGGGGTTAGGGGGTTAGGGGGGGGSLGGAGGGGAGGGTTAGGGGGGTLGGGGGGTTGGGGIGGGGGGTGIAPYLINPNRDFSLGSKTPVTVGIQSGGIGSFTPNLQIPFTQQSSALAVPTEAVPGAGATFGIAFLSDLEVYLFLTAAQGDTRTNILSAPKVTTFNGALASINNAEVINYVAQLTPIIGPGSVAFTPQVAQFNNGVFLQVTPVVSADRRYVRMTLSPNFNAIEGFDTIQIPAAVGGSGLGGASSSINATVQLPRFTNTNVQTTVTVPDGGTVLLGGVKRLNEERREFGVPVLSKTPMLNRLFRNVGIGRTTTSLMLMVTPRIIILEEEEEKLGIPTVAF